MADQSIADLLRASVENATELEPLEIQLPIFDPPVTMVLRKIKNAKVRDAAIAGLQRIKDEGDRNLQAVARLLVLACEHCTLTAPDGVEHELPKLGLPLWNFIYGQDEAAVAPQNDVQAVFALYTDATGETDTVAIADAGIEYGEWSKTASLKAHEEALGEFEPA